MPDLRKTTSTYADGTSEDRVSQSSNNSYTISSPGGSTTMIRKDSSYGQDYKTATDNDTSFTYLASSMLADRAKKLVKKNR